jgi:hypothetical protein
MTRDVKCKAKEMNNDKEVAKTRQIHGGRKKEKNIQ